MSTNKWSLFLFTFLFCIGNLSSQLSDYGVYKVITASGDTIGTNTIFKNKTNEDQLTIIYIGAKKTFLASEIKEYSYFGKYTSIKVGNEHKLVTTIIKGDLKLARGLAKNGMDRFYLYQGDKWIDLLPNASDLSTLLNNEVSDFSQAGVKKKIHYTYPSLATAMNKYNESKSSASKSIGKPAYELQKRLSIYGGIGLSQINIQGFSPQLGASVNYLIGGDYQLKFSRVHSTRLQVNFSRNFWFIPGEWLWDVRTINIAALWDVQLYSNYKNLEISISAGPVFNLNAGSVIIVQPDPANTIEQKQGISPGYEVQLHFLINNHYKAILGFQAIPNQRTSVFGEFQNTNDFVRFGTQGLSLGVGYVF